MSWIATAIVGGSIITGGATYLSTRSSAKAAEEAAGISVDAQREALAYIKENEAIPQELRKQALETLGNVYGLPGISGMTGTTGGSSLSGKIDPNTMVNYNGQQVSVQELRNKIYDLEANIADYQGYSNIGNASRNIGLAQAEIKKIQDAITTGSSIPGATGTAGTPGDTSGQQMLIDQAINSPLYGALMGGIDLGEEAIMRNAGSTGGLRSGNVQGAMFDYTTQLQNQALLQSYNEQLQGIKGLAGIPSNSSEIGGYITNIGNTQAQGNLASAAMTAQGVQGGINNALGVMGLGLEAYKAGMFSDRRLKKNIKLISKVKGFNFYSFEWNKLANMLGLYGKTYGCMAEEVYDERPEAVVLKDGFLFVKYNMIGVL